MTVVLLLLLPFWSLAVGLSCSVVAFQAESTALLAEQEQLSALGYERPDLKCKDVCNPPLAERHNNALGFTAKEAACSHQHKYILATSIKS